MTKGSPQFYSAIADEGDELRVHKSGHSSSRGCVVALTANWRGVLGTAGSTGDDDPAHSGSRSTARGRCRRFGAAQTAVH